MKIAVDARTLGSRPSGVGMYLNDFLKDVYKRQVVTRHVKIKLKKKQRQLQDVCHLNRNTFPMYVYAVADLQSCLLYTSRCV